MVASAWQIQVLCFVEVSGIFFPNIFNPRLVDSTDGEPADPSADCSSLHFPRHVTPQRGHSARPKKSSNTTP